MKGVIAQDNDAPPLADAVETAGDRALLMREACPVA